MEWIAYDRHRVFIVLWVIAFGYDFLLYAVAL
jgi:hypothetical protein